MPPRSVLLFLFFLGAHAPSAIAATMVHVERDGLPVEGAQICRFDAADAEDPFRRWLIPDSLTCSAAGTPVDFPLGLWNVFVRTGGAEVSTSPLLIDGARAPASVTLALSPAATVTPMIGDRQTAVVWAPQSGSAFPRDAATGRITVPAGQSLWLIVIERSDPVAVIPIDPLEPRTERRLEWGRGQDDASSILTWVRMSETDRAALDEGTRPPAIRAVAGESDHAAEPLPPPALLHGAFALIREIIAGPAVLEIGGRGWLPHRRNIEVRPARLNLLRQPLEAGGSATIVVNWNAYQDLAALNASLGSCDRRRGESSDTLVSLLACAPPDRATRGEPPSCQEVRSQSFAAHLRFGRMTVEDMPPGDYRAEMRSGRLPPAIRTATIPPFTTRNLNLGSRYEELQGSVRQGGEPLDRDAEIEFSGGVGFAVAETGELRAAALPSVELATDSVVKVTSCDGVIRADVVLDRPRPRGRIDIDIPRNELIIHVIDTFTRHTIPRASVRYSVISKLLPPRPIIVRELVSIGSSSPSYERSGGLSIKEVPDRQIRLTVHSGGYEKLEVPPFRVADGETKRMEIELLPLRGTAGRIVSDRPFGNATLLWVDSSGRETERTDLAPDGVFVAANAHEADERMAVVSQSHPLWVTRSPKIDRGREIAVPFPDGGRRGLAVSVEGDQSPDARVIGIVMAGIMVPQPAIHLHQSLRRMPAMLPAGGSWNIRDLADFPLEVILGPQLRELPPRSAGMDVLAFPQFAGAPRKPVPTGVSSVVFTLD
jgi:hypothetical protein